MDMITVVNGAGVLAPETVAKIAEYEKAKKEIEAKDKALRDAIKAEMEALNLVKIENEDISISYTAPHTSLRLDTGRLKKEKPDVYDDFLKVSPVGSSIKITLR